MATCSIPSRFVHPGGFALVVLVALVVSTGCQAKKTSQAWSVRVTEIVAPLHEANAPGDSPVQQCGLDEQGCAPMAAGVAAPPGSLVRTAQGVSTSLDLGRGATLHLEGGSEFAVLVEPHDTVQLRKGAAQLVYRLEDGAHAPSEAGSSPKSSETAVPLPTLGVVGVEAVVDPSFATVARIAFSGDDVADVSLSRGRLAIHADASRQLQLHPGESAHLQRDRAPERRRKLAELETAVSTAGERPESQADSAPRGLGTMTARVPGTTEVVSGVHLASHVVRVAIRDGYARTEVEEVFENETDRVLGGRYTARGQNLRRKPLGGIGKPEDRPAPGNRKACPCEEYVLPLPPDASISRLALWVGDKLVEGEVVERKKAARVFKAIVEDTVRPRDPALLEWVAGSEFSLKIFPIPAKGSRRVLLAYNQALRREAGRMRYVYPLSMGKDRTSRIDSFSIDLTLSDTHVALSDVLTPGYGARVTRDEKKADVAFQTKLFAAERDFVVTWRRGESSGTDVSAYVPTWGEFTGDGLDQAAKRVGVSKDGTGFFALRLVAELPPDAPASTFKPTDRAMVLDTSQSQSTETVRAEVRVAAGMLDAQDPEERFVLLACDSGCITWPESGLAAADPTSRKSAAAWLAKVAPGGSSDLAGALIQAVRRFDPNHAGQIVYVGDNSIG